MAVRTALNQEENFTEILKVRKSPHKCRSLGILDWRSRIVEKRGYFLFKHGYQAVIDRFGMKEIEQPMTESTVSRSNIQWGIVGQSLDIGYFLINQEIGPLEHLISKWIN